ncbi:MAG: 50S ribosomal protein L6 [Nanoarchaeota archaeon]|nr:50S ribosomal protein L6 [Nanoarchaeota archaeon]MBU1622647.1 50S ribosomal protein L6 [Nanoarchaeota archaeon]MBU1974268.1 50S ribosomal protein L6 [Nanoarchaeota archaeon]
MKEDLLREIEFPSEVKVQLEDTLLKVNGAQGDSQRKFFHPKIKLEVQGNKIILTSLKATKREKTKIGSMEAHIKNMIKGVQEKHIYKLKICSGHFPMNVSVNGQEFIIKNFLGEKVPRKINFNEKVEVKVSGTEIVVSSADKELSGQTAAKIETLCRITNRDRRIFQDGCYIIHKAGKDI